MRYVVTGASASLGQALMERLAAGPANGAEIVGIVSGRTRPALQQPGVRYVVQDLLAPLGAESMEALRAADRIVHLAWSRDTKPARAIATNLAMLDGILAVPGAGPKLVFVSSVAASPRSPSGYARAKHAAQARVLAAGGTAVVLGLVVGEPPDGGFKTLLDLLRRLPVHPKLVPNAPPVYPILKADAVRTLAAIAATAPPPGAYRAFLENGVPINDFLALLRDRFGLRKPQAPLPLAAVTAAMRLASLLGRAKLAEKLATFFYKDQDALRGLAAPPGDALAATTAELGRGRAA